jgi:hypothetical protein
VSKIVRSQQAPQDLTSSIREICYEKTLSDCAGFLSLLYLLPCVAIPVSSATEDRLRVIVETDIGGDADDQASLVRFLAVLERMGCGSDHRGSIGSEAFRRDGARDHKGLRAENGWELATAVCRSLRTESTRTWRFTSRIIRGPTYCWLEPFPASNDTDAGVRAIIQAADRDDPRPIWYGNWGSNSGSTSNLRRAFDQIKATRSRAEYQTFVRKFRICTLDGRGPTKTRARRSHRVAYRDGLSGTWTTAAGTTASVR